MECFREVHENSRKMHGSRLFIGSGWGEDANIGKVNTLTICISLSHEYVSMTMEVYVGRETG